MPGSEFTISCRGCGIEHEIHTGASSCWEHHEHWAYEQFVCESCQLVVSKPTAYCCREGDDACPHCRGDLKPWAGRVWLERQPDGITGPEFVRGPCPKCGTELREKDSRIVALWD